MSNLKRIDLDPVAEVVSHLEVALERARKGELRTIALVGRINGGDYFTAFDTDDVFSGVAMCELLKFDLLRAAKKTSV